MKNTIEKSLHVTASIDRVWQALVDHKEFGQWFRAEIADPFVVNAMVKCRSTYPGHEHMTWEMKILKIEVEQCFEFSWPAYYGEDIDRVAADDPHLVVTFALSKQDEGTLITLTESGFANLPADYAPTAYRLNEGGWQEQIKNIGAHVSD